MTEPEDLRSKAWDNLPPWLRRGIVLVFSLGLIGEIARRQWDDIRSSPNNYAWGLFATSVTALLYLVWRFLEKRFGPTSSLQNPAALRLSNQALVGRAAEIEILASRIKDNALVFLIGESGAGKSALLEHGLMPFLKDDGRWLPLYLSHWGSDWIEGPRRALSDTLNDTLQDAQREELGIRGAVRPEDVFGVIARLHHELGLRPVLLLDQFDDYQTRHRERFIFGPDRHLLRAPELVKQNPFWHGIKDLLDLEQARCIIVTREDAQWSLEAVRFLEPGLYLLPRLKREDAEALLIKLTGEAGVSHPERGFPQLRERLLRDLAPNGLLLPIQMKVALQGLAELNSLNVPAYIKAGGLSGLEALHIARSIARSSRSVGWEDSHVHRILTTMVDPSAQRKTVAQPFDNLLDTLPPDKKNRTKLASLLAALSDQGEDIVRARIERDLNTTVWLLDHDYLCRGVAELDRRARRWQILLEDSSRTFREAHGFLARWRTLLSIRDQGRLLWERLRGRLVYGGAGGYAALSSLRLIGNLWIMLGAVGLYLLSAQSEREAQRLLLALQNPALLNVQAAESLWTISQARAGLRQSILKVMTRSTSRWLDKEEILYAAVGYNEKFANGPLAGIIREKCLRSSAPNMQHLSSCTLMLNLLPQNPSTTALIRDLAKVDASIMRLHHLVEILPPEQFEAITEEVLSGLSQEKRDREFAELVEAVKGLSIRLSSTSSEKFALVLRKRWTSSTSSRQKEAILQGMQALSADLPEATILGFAEQIISEHAPAPELLMGVAIFIASNAHRLPAAISKRAVDIIDKASAEEITRHFALHQYSDSYRFPLIWSTLPDEEARKSAGRFIEKLPPFSRDLNVDIALAAFGNNPPVVVTDVLVENSISHLKLEHKLPEEYVRWIDRLDLQDSRVDQKDSNFLAAYCLNALNETRNAEERRQLAKYISLLPKADQSYRERAARLLLDRVLQASDTNVAMREAYALIGLGKKLPKDVARTATKRLLKFPPEFGSLSAEEEVTLTILSGQLSQRDADTIVANIIQRISREQSPIIDRSLLKHLAPFGHRTSSATSRMALKEIKRVALPLSSPPCRVATSFIRSPQDLPLAVEIVRWPTCHPRDREKIISRIAEVAGENFTSPEALGSIRVRHWEFAKWARNQGLDLEAPLGRPRPLLEVFPF